MFQENSYILFSIITMTQDVINIQFHGIPAHNPIVSLIVVGAGLIGPRHCSHIYQRSDCKLQAVIDHSTKGLQVAHQFNCLLFKSLEEYFEYIERNNLCYCDGAVIATPTHTHVDLGIKLASKGVNLLIEKPLSNSPLECKKLIEYVNLSSVKLLIGHHRRFNPYILSAKENMSRIGQPIAIQGNWTLKKHDDYYQEKPWRISKANGGGTLLINLVHDLDLLLYLIGPIKKIYAELLIPQRDYEVDEGAVLIITFENGCCGTFICSDNVISPFNFEAATGENPSIPHHKNLLGLYRIFGSQGTLSIPDLHLYHQNNCGEKSWLNDVEIEDLSTHYADDNVVDDVVVIDDIALQTPSPSPQMPGFVKPKPFDLQLNHFVNLIIGKESVSSCSGEDALNALLCIEAVFQSIESGKPEYVSKIDDIE